MPLYTHRNAKYVTWPIIGLLWGVVLTSSMAQSNHDLYFKNFDTGAENPLVLPNDMLQDKEGTLWITSDEGISRFDGLNFRRFYSGDGSGYRSDNPAWLAQDNTGRLWVLQKSGLGWFNSATKRFHYLAGVLTEGMAANRMVLMYDASRDCLWLGTNQGLYQFDLATYKLRKTTLVAGGNCVAIDLLNQDVMVYTTYSAVYYYYPKTGTSEEVQLPEGSPTVISSYLDTPTRTVWLGLEAQGLMALEISTRRFVLYPSEVPSISTLVKIPQLTGDSLLWMGTNSNGILLFNTHSKRYTRAIRQDIHLKSELVSDRIFKLYVAPDGSGWILNGSTLSLVSPWLTKIKKENWDTPAVYVCKVVEDPHRPEEYYMATRGKGLLRYNRVTHQHTQVDASPSATMSNLFIWGLYVDPLKNVWYANSSELICLDKAGHIRKFRLLYQQEPLRVLFLTYDHLQKVLWLIAERFVVRFDPKSGHYSVIELPPFQGFKESARANHLLVDGNKLWVGTDQGLACLSTSDGRVIQYYAEGEPASNHVHWLTKDLQGDIWVANYKGGIKRLTIRNGSYSVTGIPKEVAKLPARWLKVANYGALWIITNAGLGVFYPAQNRFKKVDVSQSITFDDAFSRPEQDDKDEQLIIDSKGRTLRISLTEPLPIFTHIPTPILTNFKVMNTLSDLPWRRKPISLLYNQNFLSFTFSVPEFIDPDRLSIKYKLDGLEENWNEAKNDREASYTNLGSGTYLFRVRVTNELGLEGAKELQIPVSIKAPFWEHPLFFLAVLGCIVGAIYVFFNYRYQEKLRLLRLQERVARDLHDDIGSQLSTISIMSQNIEMMSRDNPEQARMYLARLGETARQVMDTMSDIVWSVNPTNDELESVMKRVENFAEELFASAGTRFSLQVEERLIHEKLPLEKRHDVFLICKELLTNAAKYAHASEVNVRLFREGKHLVIDIQDNGIGFNTEGGYTYSLNGNGIPNMVSRAKKIGIEFSLESKLGEGTQAKLRIPYGTSPI